MPFNLCHPISARDYPRRSTRVAGRPIDAISSFDRPKRRWCA
jgi:hypothetical protein